MLSVIVAIMQIICPFLQMSKTSKWLFWKISLQIFVHFLQHTYFSKIIPAESSGGGQQATTEARFFYLKYLLQYFYTLSSIFMNTYHAHFKLRKIWKCWKFSYFDMTQVCIFKKTQIDQNFWTKRYLLGCEMCGLDTGFK